MSDNPAIWLDLLRQNAEQLAVQLKNSQPDRNARKSARSLLMRAFQVEQGSAREKGEVSVELVRAMVYELDRAISTLSARPTSGTTLDTFVRARYRHDAIKLWGGTQWKELVRWLEDSETMHERMLSRIDWLVERSERAAELMGGIRLSEGTTEEEAPPRETYELVKKAERKKRRR